MNRILLIIEYRGEIAGLVLSFTKTIIIFIANTYVLSGYIECHRCKNLSDNNRITGDMKIDEIVSKYPQTLRVLFQYGLGCIGCHAASYESLAEGVMAHGINLDAVLKDLNKILESNETEI
jgi:hybrid cluster-associated redox disulfide protein